MACGGQLAHLHPLDFPRFCRRGAEPGGRAPRAGSVRRAHACGCSGIHPGDARRRPRLLGGSRLRSARRRRIRSIRRAREDGRFARRARSRGADGRSDGRRDRPLQTRIQLTGVAHPGDGNRDCATQDRRPREVARAARHRARSGTPRRGGEASAGNAEDSGRHEAAAAGGAGFRSSSTCCPSSPYPGEPAASGRRGSPGHDHPRDHHGGRAGAGPAAQAESQGADPRRQAVLRRGPREGEEGVDACGGRRGAGALARLQSRAPGRRSRSGPARRARRAGGGFLRSVHQAARRAQGSPRLGRRDGAGRAARHPRPRDRARAAGPEFRDSGHVVLARR